MGKLRAVSPGGALLRGSRLFSLPQPIPDKQVPYELRIENPGSATKPHPTHQTITSPQTSREKGDWGLKRPLPLKQTMATSTPLLKVKQLDSMERVTDYGSSSDHALTLEKFNELNIAITVPRPTHDPGAASSTRMSVFESTYDFTKAPEEDPNRKGWKFSGPWLASMPSGDFEQFIKERVLPRRSEFRRLMKTKAAEELTLANRRSAQEKGTEAPAAVVPAQITDEKLGVYMRGLRNSRLKLYTFVTNFLDLPPLHVPVGLASAMNIQTSHEGAPNMRFDSQGPPPSHPSAGLGYLRTHSYMENHFLYGPQEQRKPVLSRLLQPAIGKKPPMVGVGGFVAEAPAGFGDFNQRRFNNRQRMTNPYKQGVTNLDIQTHGGAKTWVVPDQAFVDPNGMVVLKVSDAKNESKLIAQESRGEPLVYNSRRVEVNLEEQEREAARYDRTAEILTEEESQIEEGRDVMGSASAYGMDEPIPTQSPYRP